MAADERRELAQLGTEELEVTVGRREVGHRSGERELRGALEHARGDPVGVVETSRSEPTHSGVELDVHADGRDGGPMRVGGRGERADERLAPGDDLGPRGECHRQLVGADRAEHEHRRRDPGRAEPRRLVDRRNGEHRRPSGERRPRRRRRTVAVPVALHDGAETGLLPVNSRRSRTTLRSIAARLTRASARNGIAPTASA